MPGIVLNPGSARKRRAQRHESECHQAERAVHAPLQRIGNQRHAIAELHDVVDRPHKGGERRENAQGGQSRAEEIARQTFSALLADD